MVDCASGTEVLAWLLMPVEHLQRLSPATQPPTAWAGRRGSESCGAMLRRPRAFGNCWLGCVLWRQLRLEEFWAEKLSAVKRGKRARQFRRGAPASAQFTTKFRPIAFCWGGMAIRKRWPSPKTWNTLPLFSGSCLSVWGWPSFRLSPRDVTSTETTLLLEST